MSKVKFYSISDEERRMLFSDLFEVLSSLKTKQEIIDFQIGLLTPSELLMISRRIQIAKMLIAGDSYEKITKKVRVSHMTISRIERWLLADESRNKFVSQKIKRLEKQSSLNRKKKYKKISDSMLDKYAQHRFLKELIS